MNLTVAGRKPWVVIFIHSVWGLNVWGVLNKCVCHRCLMPLLMFMFMFLVGMYVCLSWVKGNPA
jgi:hypothetical protein